MPNPEFARIGGTDEFTVIAADTGFHLHGPGGVFAPGFGHTTLVKASVPLFAIGTTIDVGEVPNGVAVSPDGAAAYVGNVASGTVSVIDTATNTVTTTITVGDDPRWVAVSPDGITVYVVNAVDDAVSVIDTATNTVTATISVGDQPDGVAVSPDGATAYVANGHGDTVSVIDTATNTVTKTKAVGGYPVGVAVSPDGTIYVSHRDDGTVWAIDLPW
jgi:YVTN family beta-propeller protein